MSGELARMSAALLARLATAQGRAGGDAASPDAQSLWRYELERAQWRLHVDSTPPASPARTAAENANGDGQVALPESEGAQPSTRGGRAVPANVERDPGPSRGKNPAVQETLLEEAPSASPGGSPGNAQRALASARQAAAEIPRMRPQQRIPWPEVNAHVSVEGKRVKAWIRDASLDEAQRKTLLAQLRARLRGAGLELDSLIVNGRDEFTSS